MKTFLHIFYTWLLAHVLHAVLFPLLDYVNTGSFEFAFFAAAIVIGPVVSIPALLISWFLFQFLYLVQVSNRSRLLLWILLTTIALIGNLFLFRFFESFAVLEGLQFITPAVIACWTIILLRRNYLYSFFTLNEFENETHLV